VENRQVAALSRESGLYNPSLQFEDCRKRADSLMSVEGRRMTITDRITIDRKVMLGKPVIRGTRIPVELILRKLSGGATEADLLDA